MRMFWIEWAESRYGKARTIQTPRSLDLRRANLGEQAPIFFEIRERG
jgi:hypothetical protein